MGQPLNTRAAPFFFTYTRTQILSSKKRIFLCNVSPFSVQELDECILNRTRLFCRISSTQQRSEPMEGHAMAQDFAPMRLHRMLCAQNKRWTILSTPQRQYLLQSGSENKPFLGIPKLENESIESSTVKEEYSGTDETCSHRVTRRKTWRVTVFTNAWNANLKVSFENSRRKLRARALYNLLYSPIHKLPDSPPPIRPRSIPRIPKRRQSRGRQRPRTPRQPNMRAPGQIRNSSGAGSAVVAMAR